MIAANQQTPSIDCSTDIVLPQIDSGSGDGAIATANKYITQAHSDEWVKGSGISSTITGRNLISIVDRVEIAKILHWLKYNGSHGWYFFGCDPVTGKLTNQGQFKPNTPILFPDSDKEQKYFTFPKGGNSEIICLLLARSDWTLISEHVGVPIADEDIDETRDDLGFWQWVLNHPEIPILITEGGKKLACLLSYGRVAIALTGVWNGQQNKKIHPSLIPFIVPGRVVYLVFDADIVVKKSVQDALEVLAKLIVKAKGVVRIVTWELELGKGCDDLIVAHGADKFDEAMDTAKPYSEWLKQLEKQFAPTTPNGGGDDRDVFKEIESRFSARFRLNRLSGQVELGGKPIRVDEFYITLRRQLGLKVNKQLTIDLVMQLARENEYSPVAEYLEVVSKQYGDTTTSLLDDAGSRYFGTSDPLYNTYVKRALISAVARVLKPGCKVETALILQGKQGYFKSTFFNTLAGQWFDDSLGDASNKDERLKLRSSWVLEYAEFERAFSKRSTSDVKAFMSCCVDNLRVPYGRNIESFPRHCVLVGTSNEEEFLADPTGDRRFWIVPIQKSIDIKLLAEERDRLWAAAVALYRKGEQWWLTSEEATRSQELNQPFRVEDPWLTHIKDYVDEMPRVYTKNILENCLQLDKGKQERSGQMRVAAILKRLGFTKKPDSKGLSSWQKVSVAPSDVVATVSATQSISKLIPTDTSVSKVSVAPSEAISTVSTAQLIPTDTFLINLNKNSDGKINQFESINIADSGEQVSVVPVGIRNNDTAMVSTTDTFTDTFASTDTFVAIAPITPQPASDDISLVVGDFVRDSRGNVTQVTKLGAGTFLLGDGNHISRTDLKAGKYTKVKPKPSEESQAQPSTFTENKLKVGDVLFVRYLRKQTDHKGVVIAMGKEKNLHVHLDSGEYLNFSEVDILLMPSQETPAQPPTLKVGDRVFASNGETGVIEQIYPNGEMGVSYDDGRFVGWKPQQLRLVPPHNGGTT